MNGTTAKVSAVTERAALDPSLAEQIWLQALGRIEAMPPFPWATEIEFSGTRYAVGMGVPEYYTVLELPFTGHMEEWQVINPINSAKDMLRELSSK
jgi:hypothetical protein